MRVIPKNWVNLGSSYIPCDSVCQYLSREFSIVFIAQFYTVFTQISSKIGFNGAIAKIPYKMASYVASTKNKNLTWIQVFSMFSTQFTFPVENKRPCTSCQWFCCQNKCQNIMYNWIYLNKTQPKRDLATQHTQQTLTPALSNTQTNSHPFADLKMDARSRRCIGLTNNNHDNANRFKQNGSEEIGVVSKKILFNNMTVRT